VTDPNATVTVTVEFSGRVVNADAGDPVRNVQVSVSALGFPKRPSEWVFPTNSATSSGDGTFTLSVNLPRDWSVVYLKVTGPGYDDGDWRFEPNTAGTRAEIRIYPTLVIRPGESIDVRVEPTVNRCAFGGAFPCRRVLVVAAPGDPVELEIVPNDPSKAMGLTADIWDEEPVLRLMIAPGGLAYVGWTDAGPARAGRLTARR